jgi:hypothetical protein
MNTFCALPFDPNQLNACALTRRARYRVLLIKVPPPPQTKGEQLPGSLKQAGIPLLQAEIPLLVAYRKASADGVTAREVKGMQTPAARGLQMNELAGRLSMAEKRGKYAAALAGVQMPVESADIVLPQKDLPPVGKTGRAGWRPRQVLLTVDSIQRAEDRLKRRNDRTDFFDLIQFLLERLLESSD